MALTQKKKRFSLFGSPPMSPLLSPIIGTSLLSNYFPSQDNSSEKHSAVTEDVRKAFEALERLVSAADAYRDLMNKLCKVSKMFSKALKDYGNCKGLENTHVMCLQATSQFYDYNAEVLTKLNKVFQKDVDSLQKFWDKYSKKVIKDERAHTDYVGDLDKQVKKIGKDYEKKSKKDNTVSLNSHNNYITSISTVGSEISRAKIEYTNQVTKREKNTHSVITQLVCKLTECQFSSFNDLLKKCGPSIAKMKEWSPFVGEDMPQPQSLDDFLDDKPVNINDKLDKSSSSEKISDSLASISEKQLTAMNYPSSESNLSEPTLSIIDDNPNSGIPTKYMQIPKPKPSTLSSLEIPNSISSSEINIPSSNDRPVNQNNQKINDLKSIPSGTSDLSIGVHADDHPFFRDEKVVEVNAAELFMENRVEKAEFKPNINKVKIKEKNFVKTSKVMENKQKEVLLQSEEENIQLKEDKSIQPQKYLISETPAVEEFAVSRKAISDESNYSTLCNNNFTLPDEESNSDEKSIVQMESPQLIISKDNNNSIDLVKKNEIMPITPIINNEDESIKASKSIYDVIKPQVSETPKIEPEAIIEKDKDEIEDEKKIMDKNIDQCKNGDKNMDQCDDEMTKTNELQIEPNNDRKERQERQERQEMQERQKDLQSNHKSLNINHQEPELEFKYSDKTLRNIPSVCSVSTDSLVEAFPTELPNRSPLLYATEQMSDGYLDNNSDYSYTHSLSHSPKPIQPELREMNSHSKYEYDMDDRKREDYRYHQDFIRYEDERRYNDLNRYSKREIIHHDYDNGYGKPSHRNRGRYINDYYHKREDLDDSYYISPRAPIHYIPRDRSPPRRYDLCATRSYSDPNKVGISVANIRDRFQTQSEERRHIHPREVPIPLHTGRVSDLTSRFGGTRNESRNDIPNSSILSRNVDHHKLNSGYRSPDDERYFCQIRREGSPIHNRHCDCYHCQPTNITNSGNVKMSHNYLYDSNFEQRNYR
ncbi:2444_t:CDS:2 [Diversispora eburnea]|uniref:2444_t:CDS:1 n=1 Tax=Diversispora eburnea TaxID=1213867 RepID=A0A9N9G8M9_9GLOM|nr:2444_t:CDS:2 [Diversispora eburnea]